MKEAATFENGGLRKEAYEKYNTVYTGWGKAEARVGMKRVAQSILNEKLSAARMSCLSGNYENALSLYEDAFAFENQMTELELQSGSIARENYMQCRNDYIDFLYRTAEEHVFSENFESAHRLINKIFYLDRNNKMAQYLSVMCDILPNYNAGLRAMELGMYRDAYIYFNEVNLIDAGYKDTRTLLAACLEQASFTIAYVPINNHQVDDAVESVLSTTIKYQILKLDDPFIQLVERENLDQLITEQMNTMDGIFDESTVIEAGKLMGSRYIVLGEVISYSNDLGRMKEQVKKGYLGNNVSSKKIKYNQFEQSRKLNATFRYQLVDAETGRIYATETIPIIENDKVVWTDFEGDHSLIYPGEWKWQLITSKEDLVNFDARDLLQSQFKAKRDPKSEMELRMIMLEFIGMKVASAVSSFRP